MLVWPLQSDDEIFETLNAMQREGVKISAASLKGRLGGGSHGRLTKLVQQWQKQHADLPMDAARERRTPDLGRAVP
ncbi:DNA-binding protein [Azospirillum sp. SYSU D00513]|uniref:DNA-binding protein n=1 Tax=Azospirillum sp. SYSU D00513 TaxID=2812561 RepID=UPI001A956F52|nr:DNA-binding protein [Azospirillum sp. SYSU D00513]